jgi:hypothetical protein
MLELATVGLVLGGAHLAAVYLGTDVLRLEYSQMLALNVSIAVITSLVLRATMPSWKPRVDAAVRQEVRQGKAFADVGLMMLAFIAGGVGSGVLMYRRYGPVGWLGMVGASSLVNWLV